MSVSIPKCVIRGCRHFKNLYSRSGDAPERAKWEQLNESGCANCDCDAFPEGIPMEIAFGSNPHTEHYKGDNGIQYEPKE